MTIVVRDKKSGEVFCYHTCANREEAERHLRFYRTLPDLIATIE